MPLQNIGLARIQKKQTEAKMVKQFQTIASDSFRGRNENNSAYPRVVRYLEKELMMAHVKTFFDSGFRDTFYVHKDKAVNLVGFFGNEKADSAVLICAHFDHLGTNDSSIDSVYNGANDNASGVVAILQMAKFLAHFSMKEKVIVALLSGEEDGLLGSKHLSKRLLADSIPLKWVLNFEMIGKKMVFNDQKVYLTGCDLSNFQGVANQLLGNDFITKLPAEKKERLFYRSDNYPFYKLFGIPAHTLSSFDFNNDSNYHGVDDEFEQININHFCRVVHLSTLMMAKLIVQKPIIKLLF
jgi:Zn-dependent M28 family amino/carboxypeptidase